MSRLYTLLLLLVLIVAARSGLAQTADCYPNCSVDFEAIVHERVPIVPSVAALGTKCDAELARLLKGYRDEDAQHYALLRNQYCSALAGWEQIADCEHGGPPPCCTAPASRLPWRQVGTASAKAALFTEWHRIQSNRGILAERALSACLRGLKGEGLSEFNDSYARAVNCLKEMQGDADYYNATQVVDGHITQSNRSVIDGYAAQLSSLHQRMQALANGAPDPNGVQRVSNEMTGLLAEVCGRAHLRGLGSPNDKGIRKPSREASGSRAEVQQPQVESMAVATQGAAIKGQYEQQSNANLQAADKSTTEIDRAKNLSMARINAIGSGNETQIRQVEQAQNIQSQHLAETSARDVVGLALQIGDLVSTKKANAKEQLNNSLIENTFNYPENFRLLILAYNALREKDYDLYKSYLEQGANRGSLRALLELGNNYSFGYRGYKKDTAKAKSFNALFTSTIVPIAESATLLKSYISLRDSAFNRRYNDVGFYVLNSSKLGMQFAKKGADLGDLQSITLLCRFLYKDKKNFAVSDYYVKSGDKIVDSLLNKYPYLIKISSNTRVNTVGTKTNAFLDVINLKYILNYDIHAAQVYDGSMFKENADDQKARSYYEKNLIILKNVVNDNRYKLIKEGVKGSISEMTNKIDALQSN